MLEPFAQSAWAETHEKLAADVHVGLAGLARWLRRRAKAKDEVPAVTQGGDRRTRRALRPVPRQGAEGERDAALPLRDRCRADGHATTITELRAKAKV